MKRYKIGKYIIDAESPTKALNIAKILDNKVKDRVYANDVRNMCIKYNWYTNGTVGQYSKMLIAAQDNEWTLEEIAFDIANHSENVSKSQVLTELKKINVADSMKDANMEDIKEIEVTDSYESNIYKILEIVRKSNSAAQPIDYGGTLGFKVFSADIDNIVRQIKKAIPNVETTKHKSRYSAEIEVLKRSIKDSNSVKDEDISYLTQEEEKAIADYKAAIANTKDPKLLKLYQHILEEEIEHLEELQSAETKDSADIDKILLDDKYFKFKYHYDSRNDAKSVYANIKFGSLYSVSDCDSMMSSLNKVKELFEKNE